MHASAKPRRIRTTKSEAKLLHGICNNKIPPLIWVKFSLYSNKVANDPDYFNDSPDNEVHSQVLGHRETLQCHILRDLCKQIAEIEN